MKLNGTGPVFGIDIDGTLGDYHGHFIRFAEGYTGRSLPDPADVNPLLPFHKFLGLGKSTYRQIKMAYRQGGLKRSMPCYAGARELTVALRKAGAEVWICTTRPFNQLGNVDADTRHWLRRNGIQYDNVLWGERKYLDLVKRTGRGRVVAVLEDLPKMVEQAYSSGIIAYLRAQPYNAKYEGPFMARADSLDIARELLLSELDYWRKNSG